MRLTIKGLFVLGAVALLSSSARAEGTPNFNKRGTGEKDEKAFVEQVADTIVHAARSCKDVTVRSYKFKEVKEGQTDLVIEAGYKGVVTKKPYSADVTVHINSASKGKWSVLSIDYTDNNKLKWTGKGKVDGLVSKFNDASK